MDSKDGALYFLTALIGLGIWVWIIYSIIKSASKAEENIFYQKRIYRFLNELALKTGVNQEALDAIRNDLPIKRPGTENIKK